MYRELIRLIMNDYFLKILIQQRHESILAAVRGAQRLKPARTRVTHGNKVALLLRSFYSRCKSPMAFELPGAIERRTL